VTFLHSECNIGSFMLCEQAAVTCKFSYKFYMFDMPSGLLWHNIWNLRHAINHKQVDPIPPLSLFCIMGMPKILFEFWRLKSRGNTSPLENAKFCIPPSFWTRSVRHVWVRQRLMEAEALRSSLLQRSVPSHFGFDFQNIGTYTVCPGSVRTHFFNFFLAMPSVGELWR
jgi:hypothetical protein